MFVCVCVATLIPFRTRIAACYPCHQVEASLIRTSIHACVCVRGHICRYDQLLAEYRRGRQYHSDKAAPRADEIAAYAKHLGVGAHAHLRPSLSWVVEEAYVDCRRFHFVPGSPHVIRTIKSRLS